MAATLSHDQGRVKVPRRVPKAAFYSQTVLQFQMGGVVRIDRDEAGYWVVRWALTSELLPSYQVADAPGESAG